MAYKPLIYRCERCGMEASLERTGRFNDDDFYEVFHERMDFEARLRERSREHKAVASELCRSEHDTFFWKSQAALYRAQLIAAGVEPMDCSEELMTARAALERTLDDF